MKDGMTKEIGESLSNNSVGVLFFAKSSQRHLFLLRNSKYTEWGLPGGKVEKNETLRIALERECMEEINYWPPNAKLFPIEQFNNQNKKFIYHTFYCIIDSEFIPILNNEHIGYCWVHQDIIPTPLHKGLFNTLNYGIIKQKIQIIQDAFK